MSNDRCGHCMTEYGGDFDEWGRPLCDCDGAELARANERIAELEEACRAILKEGFGELDKITWARDLVSRLEFAIGQYDTIDGRWWLFIEGVPKRALTDEETSLIIWGKKTL